MKIVIDEKIPNLKARLSLLHPDWEVEAKEGVKISATDVSDADALIVRTRTRCDESLLRGSRVRLVGTATIGTDHIDTAWCRANGIRVANAPGCNAPAVMQYVASSLHEAGFDPKHHRLGVVGKGNIGSLVVDIYRREGTDVLVCDPPRAQLYADEDYVSLKEILHECDAVTFHVPFTTDGPYPTYHLLSGILPPRPAIIVNASRGPVVDPDVIRNFAYDKKFIIDTWPFEEYPEEFTEEMRAELIRRSFIATPHIAGYSYEGKERATEAMITALEGRPDAQAEKGRGRVYNLQETIRSFNPVPLSETLKANPAGFEAQRGSHLRHEPISVE